jgi:diguanylate cyclase (GGDEF)-like protein
MAIPRAGSTWTFGAIGVAYSLVLVAGLALNVSGVEQPLLWVLPALVVIPICAAPLWLTPMHFCTGSVLFYAAAFALLSGEPRTHEVDVVVWMWIVAIGVPTSAVFHFGFYRFRRNHFLLESQLAQLAATDPLTGLQNRRAFVKQAERRLENIQPDMRVSAIFLDIDNFKSLNDRFGHAVGDHALYQVAQVLMEETSADDSVSRIGGEEFAVLLPETGASAAGALAERLRKAVEAEPFDVVGKVTVSVGVASLDASGDAESLVGLADTAMYWAKSGGRNATCSYSEEARAAISAGSARELAVP